MLCGQWFGADSSIQPNLMQGVQLIGVLSDIFG